MSVIATLARLDSATDGQLLGRFVQARDPDAFAALVRRLGPAVLAVCRRVCPDAHLADDAFQAAFLVLARKADSVRPRERVAVWLHGVAFRTASKARTMLAARRRREVGSADLPDPPAAASTPPPDDELATLDAAIAALPDHLRAAVVLCELDGRSRKDAAKQLGIAEGTLSSRLGDARKRLRRTLRPTTAVVSLALLARTADAATGGAVSPTVLTLARGAMSMALFRKLIPAAVALALTLPLAAVVAAPPPADDKPQAKPPAASEAKDELKWKLTKGDVFYLTVDTDADTKLLPSANVKLVNDSTQQRGTAVWKVTVTAAGKDGLAVEVESVSHTAGKGEGRQPFKPGEVAGMAGGKFTAAFDADRKLKTVSDGEALDKAAAAARGQGLSVPPTAVVANTLEQLFRMTPAALPGKDGGWEWTTESTHPQTKLVTSWARQAKLDGIKDGVATVTTETEYQVQAGPETKEPFLNVSIRGTKCGGTFTFDTRTGRLVKFEETITFGGPLPPKADIGNLCTHKSTYTVTAKPPETE